MSAKEYNMFELQSIPAWMRPLIAIITDGAYRTEEELRERMENIKSWETGVVVSINQRIDMVKALHEAGLYKPTIKKPITEVQMGEIFKIYEGQERYYTLQSTKVEDEYIMVREYTGGRGHNMSSAWLLEPNNCHADIEVEIVAGLPEKFHM